MHFVTFILCFFHTFSIINSALEKCEKSTRKKGSLVVVMMWLLISVNSSRTNGLRWWKETGIMSALNIAVIYLLAVRKLLDCMLAAVKFQSQSSSTSQQTKNGKLAPHDETFFFHSLILRTSKLSPMPSQRVKMTFCRKNSRAHVWHVS